MTGTATDLYNFDSPLLPYGGSKIERSSMDVDESVLTLGLLELAAEFVEEHRGEVHCDVCDLWYDEEDPCPYH
jgi:hypothetical protein